MKHPLLAAPLAALLALSACDSAAPSHSADALATSAAAADARPAAAGPDGLAAVRRATARYQEVDRAVADGWGAVAISECVAVPGLGGMGYHYINLGLMDGTVDASAPEALLYEPQKNGRLRLVGVEYIVPFGAEPRAADGGTAPELFGEHFHESEAAGGWALRAWVWRHNPAGTFADFNPAVTCEHAESPGR